MTELTDFRKAKDEFFKEDLQSPLDVEQKRLFKGLHYFPEDHAFRLSVPLEKVAEPTSLFLATSTGDEQEYLHVGQIRFKVKNQEGILQVYISVNGGDYFIPFVDATAPAQTYGGGRYLEPKEIKAGLLLVDFNYAYNPYCAYNDRWSCPIPPLANKLPIRIEAGEMKFHEKAMRD